MKTRSKEGSKRSWKTQRWVALGLAAPAVVVVAILWVHQYSSSSLLAVRPAVKMAADSTVAASVEHPYLPADFRTNPYDLQVGEQLQKLESSSPHVRAGAVESLGFMRAYAAEGAILDALRDPSSLVRREAALALAWAGGRHSVEPLLKALKDGDWVVRQAAAVSLSNLTSRDLSFDALAEKSRRDAQIQEFSNWWTLFPQTAFRKKS